MAEYNLIQNPELIRRLAAVLGLRQPHITPTLNEGIQSVVVVGDVRDEPEFTVSTWSASADVDGDLVSLGGGAQLQNPFNSTVFLRVLVASIAIPTDNVQRIGIEIADYVSDPPPAGQMPNILSQRRGRNWERGTGAGAPNSVARLWGGTLAANTLSMYSTYIDPIRTGGVARLELDLQPYRIHVPPGHVFRIGYVDQVPVGEVTVLWEERTFEPATVL